MKKRFYILGIASLVVLSACGKESIDINKENDLVISIPAPEATELPEATIIPSSTTPTPEPEISVTTIPTAVPVIQEGIEIVGDILISYTGKAEEVIVPEEVCYIGEGAFQDNKYLKRVILPEGMIRIRKDAFNGCTNLEKVSMPSTLTYIENQAFYNCKGLKEIDLSKVKSIGKNAFYQTFLLKEADLENVEELGVSAFMHSGLSSVAGMEKLETLEYGVFHDTKFWTDFDDSMLIKNGVLLYAPNCGGNVVIPDEVKAIREEAFMYNDKITSVVIPETVTTIGDRAFAYCSNLQTVDMGDSVTEIGGRVFLECYKLEQIRLSNNLQEIKNGCFEYCRIMEELTIPENCMTLSENSFRYYGKKYKSITFPPDIEVLDGLADSYRNQYKFYTTEFVTNSALAKTAEEFGWDLQLAELENTELKLTVTEESILRFNSGAIATWTSSDEAIVVVEPTESFSEQRLIALKEGTATITATLYGKEYTCNVMVEASAGEKVQPVDIEDFVIENDILVRYEGIEREVSIPDGVKEIAAYAFYANEGMTAVIIPESVEKIGAYAFEKCENLCSVYMGDSVTEIGQGAFYYCPKLQQIRLSKGLESIPQDCFGECNIRELTIPERCETKEGSFDFYGREGRTITISPNALELSGLDDKNRERYDFYTTEIIKGSNVVKLAEKYGWNLQLLELEATELTLAVGEEYLLRFNSGADAEWASSDATVVSVEPTESFAEQKLTALKPGTAVITATIYGKEYTCTVTVEQR
ncbi:MAG: leucine-rich repeat protein [Lachnospiraceae bacterium]|nr:leucine-rich repeat protein [Lachnospiraceae bacterium]